MHEKLAARHLQLQRAQPRHLCDYFWSRPHVMEVFFNATRSPFTSLSSEACGGTVFPVLFPAIQKGSAPSLIIGKKTRLRVSCLQGPSLEFELKVGLKETIGQFRRSITVTMIRPVEAISD
ncbi:hypothetical protein AB1N83_008654 [Pleurotus pulmonarius]